MKHQSEERPLRVYLAGPIASGHNKELSSALLEHVESVHTVTNPGIADPDFYDRKQTPAQIFRIARESLLSSDSVIAEITKPSHGVGFELALASINRIATLCIYQPSIAMRVSAMIMGAPGMEVVVYEDLDTATGAIDRFLAKQVAHRKPSDGSA